MGHPAKDTKVHEGKDDGLAVVKSHVSQKPRDVGHPGDMGHPAHSHLLKDKGLPQRRALAGCYSCGFTVMVIGVVLVLPVWLASPP
jgi:hypothetical protein